MLPKERDKRKQSCLTMFVYTTGHLFNVPLTGKLLNRAQIRTKTGCSNYSSQLPMFSSAIPISLPAVTPFHSDLQVFLGFFLSSNDEF